MNLLLTLPLPHTSPIILLVEQRENLDVPLPQIPQMVLQSLHAVFHRRKGHERFAAGSLLIILTDYD